MEHPEGHLAARRRGELSAWKTKAEVQPSPLPTLLAARKECGPYAQAAVVGGEGTAARGSRAGRKQTDQEEGEGAHEGMGVVGREDLALALQHKSPAAQPHLIGAQTRVPARRCCASTNTEGPCTSGAPSPQGHRLRAPPAPRPAAPYLNAQSGSRASRPGAPSPLLLLKSFWNSVGAMMNTARPGSLLRALARPPLLKPPRHPHERLSHMTEISHFKRPRRAGRGARQDRRPLAGSEPHHVAARKAGGKAGAWGGAGPHRLKSGFPHVAAHGAGCARKGGEGRRIEVVGEVRGERSRVAVLLRDVVCCYLRLLRGGGNDARDFGMQRLRLPAPTTERDA